MANESSSKEIGSRPGEKKKLSEDATSNLCSETTQLVVMVTII